MSGVAEHEHKQNQHGRWWRGTREANTRGKLFNSHTHNQEEEQAIEQRRCDGKVQLDLSPRNAHEAMQAVVGQERLDAGKRDLVKHADRGKRELVITAECWKHAELSSAGVRERDKRGEKKRAEQVVSKCEGCMRNKCKEKREGVADKEKQDTVSEKKCEWERVRGKVREKRVMREREWEKERESVK